MAIEVAVLCPSLSDRHGLALERIGDLVVHVTLGHDQGIELPVGERHAPIARAPQRVVSRLLGRLASFILMSAPSGPA